METSEKEKYENIFLKDCEKIIKKYPSKNITGKCKDCFLFHIIESLDNFRSFTKNNNSYSYSDCYRVATFLQDVGLIKIKNGIANDVLYKTMYIDCDKFSFLDSSLEKNKI